MAFLRKGQFKKIAERVRLIELVQSITPRPSRNSSKSEWFAWSMAMEGAHMMSNAALRNIIASRKNPRHVAKLDGLTCKP